jgi:hypothetical protein
LLVKKGFSLRWPFPAFAASSDYPGPERDPRKGIISPAVLKYPGVKEKVQFLMKSQDTK